MSSNANIPPNHERPLYPVSMNPEIMISFCGHAIPELSSSSRTHVPLTPTRRRPFGHAKEAMARVRFLPVVIR